MADIAELHSPLEAFEEQAAPATRVRGYWQSVAYRLRHDPATLIFGAAVLLIVLAALCAPWIAPFDPYKESIVGRLKPFGWRDHLLGTDELGRDMLSRILYGGRVSLLMGVVPVLIASLIGGLLGIIGGFVGGRVNTAIMRTMDVFYAFPSVLLAVAIAGAMGGGIGNGMLALTLVFIPPAMFCPPVVYESCSSFVAPSRLETLSLHIGHANAPVVAVITIKVASKRFM